MTRRALFARLAGMLGVPYVAKALPVALKPGDVFTLASVNVENPFPVYEWRGLENPEPKATQGALVVLAAREKLQK